VGLPSDHNLSYIMANVSGQVVFNDLFKESISRPYRVIYTS